MEDDRISVLAGGLGEQAIVRLLRVSGREGWGQDTAGYRAWSPWSVEKGIYLWPSRVEDGVSAHLSSITL